MSRSGTPLPPAGEHAPPHERTKPAKYAATVITGRLPGKARAVPVANELFRSNRVW
jgi:hypothetical protein